MAEITTDTGRLASKDPQISTLLNDQVDAKEKELADAAKAESQKSKSKDEETKTNSKRDEMVVVVKRFVVDDEEFVEGREFNYTKSNKNDKQWLDVIVKNKLAVKK